VGPGKDTLTTQKVAFLPNSLQKFSRRRNRLAELASKAFVVIILGDII